MKKNYCFEWEQRIPILKKLLIIMKLTFFLIAISAFSVLANKSYSQTVSLNMEKVTLKEVLSKIEDKSGCIFMYSEKFVDVTKTVSIYVENEKIEPILNTLFTGSDIKYERNGRLIILTNDANNSTSVSQQQKSVSGVVTDTFGGPLPGVSVVVKGTDTGTITNADGKYSLVNISSNAILAFSFVGMKTQEVTIDGKTTINVTLEEETFGIEEVVAVGYGTVRKADVTGSSAGISAKDFAFQNVTRLDQVLQGRATGVQVESTTGAPGGAVKIRIRGANSILGDNNPLYVVDGFVGADYNNINPEDIEDTQVLKDASATAIYGSRGANGVILVTTKKGKKGKMTFDFTSMFSSSEVSKKLDVLSAGDFAQVVNERNIALGFPQYFSNDQMAEFRSGAKGTDWQDEIFRTGYSKEYQLSVSGGSEKTRFFISGNYLNQEGIVESTDFTKYLLRSNINSDITDKLSTRLNIALANRISNNTGTATGAAVSAISQALAWSPTTSLIDPATGDYTHNDALSSINANPMAILNRGKNVGNDFSVNIIGGVKYEIFPGLTVDISGAVDHNESTSTNFIAGLQRPNKLASAFRQLVDYTTLLNTNMLTYDKRLGEHSINLTAVYEQSKYTSEGFNATANALSTEVFTYYALNLGEPAISSIYTNAALRSLLGRAVYSYKDRYSVSGSIRRDGSSKFRGDNIWSIFPSVGLSWRASEEGFLKESNLFDNLKFRFSWGKTGNQAVGSYATLARFASARFTFDRGASQPILRFNQTANPDLKWETNTQTNAGVDMGFFDNRLGFTFDVFEKITSDLLVPVPLPMYNGGGTINQNVGTVSNKGLEFSINATPVATKDFNWTSIFNFSLLKNKVTALADVDILHLSNNLTGAFPQPEMALVVGQPFGSYWGIEYLGTWKPSEAAEAAKFGKVPGDSRYNDVDGNYLADDFKVIGNAFPEYNIGWNNTFTYKNLTLNVFLQGIFGFDKWNITYAQGMTYESAVKEAIFSDIKNRYIPGVNETSDIPAFTTTNTNIVQSSRFMEKGDFLRVRNISLSYNLPKSVLNFAAARLFVSGTNLFTFTKYSGYDPESTSYGPNDDRYSGIDYGGYPNAKTITGGVTLSF